MGSQYFWCFVSKSLPAEIVSQVREFCVMACYISLRIVSYAYVKIYIIIFTSPIVRVVAKRAADGLLRAAYAVVNFMLAVVTKPRITGVC